MEDITKPTRGAIIYAGNDSLIKVGCHRDREDGRVLAYEKLKPFTHGEYHGTCEVPIVNTSKSKYIMVPVDRGAEYVIYAPTHMQGRYCKAYSDQANTQRRGVIKMEAKPLENGKFLSKGDSHGMFYNNAQALNREYTESVVLKFSNIQVDGVKVRCQSEANSETRQNFLATMRKFREGFQFFAYCGHGSLHGLPSACISTSDGYDAFVKELKRILLPEATIILYACSTGGKQGFAQSISRSFPQARVFAHTTARRGDDNPDTVVFEGGTPTTFEAWLGRDNFQLWSTKVLDKHHNKLYLQFPWMSKERLLSYIGAKTAAA